MPEPKDLSPEEERPEKDRAYMLFDRENKPTKELRALLDTIGVEKSDIRGVNDELQKLAFQRATNGQQLERWQLNKIETEGSKKEIMEHLANCGFVNESEPTQKHYDRAAFPGLLMGGVIKRLADLVSQWEKGVRFEELVIFSGERSLFPWNDETTKGKPEETPAVVVRTCKEYDLKFNLEGLEGLSGEKGYDFLIERGIMTEADMIEWLFKNIKLPKEMDKVKITMVKAPMKNAINKEGKLIVDSKTGEIKQQRPDTEDTIKKWLETNPTPGSILVTSGAPYNMAQHEAFRMYLEPKGHTVETFGRKAPDNLPLQTYLREVAICINRINRARSQK